MTVLMLNSKAIKLGGSGGVASYPDVSPAQTGTFNLTTTVAGVSRQFLMQVMTDYTPTTSYTLTFVYHGLNGTSATSQGYGLQTATGASEASIFCFPNGLNGGWDDSSSGVDFTYFDNMCAQIKSLYNIKQIFVAGFSFGGDMATALVTARGDKIRAAIVNSATFDFSNTSDFTTYIDYATKTTTHPAIRFEHAIGFDSFYEAPKFATTSALFQNLNNCSGGSTAYTATQSSNSATYESCVSYNNGTQLTVECPFTQSMGHVLPPNWIVDAWAFLAQFL